MKPETVSRTSAVFVTDGTFEEPMEYPQGANNLYVRCLQAHPCCGIQNPGMRHPHYTAGSQKRLHGTGGGFFFFRDFLCPVHTWPPCPFAPSDNREAPWPA